MKLLSTKAHGYLDYTVGAFLVLCPWVFGLNISSAEGFIFIALGGTALIYSMITAYECGLLRIIPFTVHLWLDILSGVLLAASPWLFGFADRIYLPHLLLGLFEIIAAGITQAKPVGE